MNAIHRLQDGVRHTYFGWWIVAGGIGIQIIAAGLVMQAYSTYVAVWQEEFAWSATTFAVAFALQRGVMALLSPFQGRLLQRLGPRMVIQVGLIILAIGFGLLSRFETQTGFFVAFLVMAFGVGLSGFLSLTTTVVNWFERRRSSALALMQIGISIGGFAVPAVAWLITTQGWRTTSLLSGVLVLVVGLPLSALMRSSPEAYGIRMDNDPEPAGEDESGDHAEAQYEAADQGEARDETGKRMAAQQHDGQPSEAQGGTKIGLEASGAAGSQSRGARVVSHDKSVGSAGPTQDFRTRDALRTRAFWLITGGHATAVTLVAAVSVHIVVHLIDGLGFTLQSAATIVAIMTGATMVGQLIGGFLGDRFPKRTIASLAMLGHAAALLAVAFATNLGMVLFFAVVHGLSWGMRGPIMQALRADYFGRASFATIMGISFSFVMVGQMLGPLLAGALADALGSYRVAFTVLAALVGLGSLFFVFASPPMSPDRRGREG